MPSPVLQTKDLHEGRSHLHLVVPEGQLQVHTAPYRGSFSRVLSEALRAAGLGRKVLVAQFLKGGVNQGPSGTVELCKTLKWLRPAIPYCLTECSSQNTLEESQNLNHRAVEDIWEVCKTHLFSGDLDQLVLDEIGLAIEFGYLKAADLISTLQERPNTMDVIMTGPSIPTEAIAMADQVTELRCGF